MISRLCYHVFARIFNNPIQDCVQQDLTVDLIASQGLVRLEKVAPGYGTHYLLAVPEVARLAMTAINNDNTTSSVVRDLLLSLNLLLDRFAISSRELRPDSVASVEFSPVPAQVATTVDADGNTRLSIVEYIRVTDRVALLLKANRCSINEDFVLDIFHRLRALDRQRPGAPWATVHHNLAAGMAAYEEAMNAGDLALAFKSLYVALEKTANCDRERSGDQFDKHASTLCSLTEDRVWELRCAYSRLKHIDRNAADTNLRVQGEKHLPHLLLNLRRAANAVIRASLPTP